MSSRIPLRPNSRGGPLLEGGNAIRNNKRKPPPEPSESQKSKRQAVGKQQVQQIGSGATEEPPNPPEVEEQAPDPSQVLSELVSRKLSFKKGYNLNKKVEMMGGFIKEFRAAGQALLENCIHVNQELEEWKRKTEEENLGRREDKEEFEKERLKKEAEAKDLEERLNTRLKESREALEAKNQQLLSAEEKIKRGEETHQSLQECNSSLQERMQQAHERNDNLLEEVTRLTGSLQKNIKEAEMARIELNNEILEAKGENVALKGKCEMFEEQYQKNHEQIEHLQQELTRIQDDRNSMKTELMALQAEAEKLRASSGAVQEEMKNMEYKKAAIEGHFTDQGSLLEDLRRQLRVAQEGQKITSEWSQRKDEQLSEIKAEKEALQAAVAQLEEKVQEGERLRKKLHNTILELKGNIRVFGRVRPATGDEVVSEPGSSNPIVSFPTVGEGVGRGIVLMAPSAPRQPFQQFAFDFDQMFSPKSTQCEVFEEVSQLVQSALDGYKVCIFAYGQTGTGKTYTMLGTQGDQGVIPRAMHMLFAVSEELKLQGWKFTMHASMLEIYNEEIRDLLLKGSSAGKSYKVSHDQQGNTNVAGLTLVDVQEPAQIEKLLLTAMDKRAVGATKMNEVSSRSHMVFALKIDGYNTNTHQSIHGVLNLVDLAGSERVKESGASGERLKEAQNINKSLSALGDVILALTNKSDHIPYRNSSLTRLLQPSLGGSAKTLMFVNIAPTRSSAPESLCSLRFAAKVNACEVGVAKRNVGNKGPKKGSPMRA